MIGNANALAERVRVEELSRQVRSTPRGFYFSPEGEITGEFEPVLQPAVRAAPSVPCGVGNNWAGRILTQAAEAPAFVQAQGTWKVPQVSQPLQDSEILSGVFSLTDNGWDSATWVGIDGFGAVSNQLLQAGTIQLVIENSDLETQYFSWFEWVPDDLNFIFVPNGAGGLKPMPTAPGDVFTANISYQGSGGSIVLMNVTQNVGFSISLNPPGGATRAGASVEWIMESPCEQPVIGANRLASLPAFTPVNFTQASSRDSAGNVGDPNSASATRSDISRTDFLGQNVQLTHVTSPGPNQVTVEFVDWYDNNVTSLAVGAPPAAAPGRMIAFPTTFNNQQHIVYLSTADSDVHELFFPNSDNKWEHRDLTKTMGTPTVAAGSSLVGYQTATINQEHVDFIDSVNHHVFELWFDTAWHPHDLTAEARMRNGATPDPVATTALTGYATDFNRQQHINFIGLVNGQPHVQELWHDDAANTWNWNDVTQRARDRNGVTPNPIAGSPLDGYASNWNSQQHVNFIGLVNGVRHVQELWHNESPNQWNWNDLTAAAPGAPIPVTGTSLNGYVTTFNTQQHVNFFTGANNQVGELFYLTGCVPTSTQTCWQFSNLSTQPGIPATPARTTALAGYQTDFNNQEHANFISSADNDVRELFFTDHWQPRDLTAIPQVPAASKASPASKLAGYETTRTTPPPPGSPQGTPPTVTAKQEHVAYVDADGGVHELLHGP
jgi:hypothetical protein